MLRVRQIKSAYMNKQLRLSLLFISATWFCFFDFRKEEKIVVEAVDLWESRRAYGVCGQEGGKRLFLPARQAGVFHAFVHRCSVGFSTNPQLQYTARKRPTQIIIEPTILT